LSRNIETPRPRPGLFAAEGGAKQALLDLVFAGLTLGVPPTPPPPPARRRRARRPTQRLALPRERPLRSGGGGGGWAGVPTMDAGMLAYPKLRRRYFEVVTYAATGAGGDHYGIATL
jgi:hypothetical protein